MIRCPWSDRKLKRHKQKGTKFESLAQTEQNIPTNRMSPIPAVKTPCFWAHGTISKCKQCLAVPLLRICRSSTTIADSIVCIFLYTQRMCLRRQGTATTLARKYEFLKFSSKRTLVDSNSQRVKKKKEKVPIVCMTTTIRCRNLECQQIHQQMATSNVEYPSLTDSCRDISPLIHILRRFCPVWADDPKFDIFLCVSLQDNLDEG